MNGLELRVRETDLDQQRQINLRMEKFFEIAERLRYNIGWRWDEGGFVQRAAARADPVLRVAQLARRKP